MKFLTLFVLSAALVALAPLAAMATCYHGCIDYDVDIGYGIKVVDAAEASCTACAGGDTYSYKIEIYESGCGGIAPVATKTLAPPHNLWVRSYDFGTD